MLRINIMGMREVVRDALRREGLPHDPDLVERLSAAFIEGIYPNSKTSK